MPRWNEISSHHNIASIIKRQCKEENFIYIFIYIYRWRLHKNKKKMRWVLLLRNYSIPTNLPTKIEEAFFFWWWVSQREREREREREFFFRISKRFSHNFSTLFPFFPLFLSLFSHKKFLFFCSSFLQKMIGYLQKG